MFVHEYIQISCPHAKINLGKEIHMQVKPRLFLLLVRLEGYILHCGLLQLWG
jgi:hypothetical protein